MGDQPTGGLPILVLVLAGALQVASPPATTGQTEEAVPTEGVGSNGQGRQGEALERRVAAELVRLDERLGLGTFPDHTGLWTARLAASLEFLIRDPASPGAAAPELMSRLAIQLRHLGVERSLEEPPAVAPRGSSRRARREPPSNRRVGQLRRILETARLLEVKLDRIESRDRGRRPGSVLLPSAAPVNDECPAAITISDGTISGSTTEATADGTASCGSSDGTPDLWYRYTAADSGPVTFGIRSSDYDTVLSVHAGCPGDGRDVELACDDDSGESSRSRVTLSLGSGEEVWVRVSGYAGATGVFELTTTRMRTISGRVTREDTGAALAGATVSLHRQGSHYPTQTTSAGPDGSYAFAAPADATYRVFAEAAGMVPELYDDYLCPSYTTCYPSYQGTPIEPASMVTTGIDLALSASGSIAGAVTDSSTGDPLDAYVGLYSTTGDLLVSLDTGPDGVYQIDGIPEGEYYVRASARDYETQVWDGVPCPRECDVSTGALVVVTDEEPVTGIDFGLETLGGVAGKVTDAATGDPVPRPEIIIYDSTGSYWFSRTGNADGTYRVEGLESGSYFVGAQDDAYQAKIYEDVPCPYSACDPTTGTAVTVSVETTTGGIDLALTPRGRIRGTVTDAVTGEPVSGMGVIAYSEESYAGSHSTSTAEDGTYDLPVPPARIFVQTSAFDTYRDEAWDDVPCGDSCDPLTGTGVEVPLETVVPGIDFVLDRWGTIRGVMTSAETGEPISSLVVAYDVDGAEVERSFGSVFEGFTLEDLPPGTYYVRTDHSDSASGSYQDELYDDVPCEPSCELAAGAGIPVNLNSEVLGADFDLAPCPADSYVSVAGAVFSYSRIERACERLSAGDGTRVTADGTVRFLAGGTIVLGDGFSVEAGGSFRAEIVPEWSDE